MECNRYAKTQILKKFFVSLVNNEVRVYTPGKAHLIDGDSVNIRRIDFESLQANQM